MNTDSDRLDWLCQYRASVSLSKTRGEWRIYDYDVKGYIGFGQTSREAIDNAMANYGEEK